MRWQRPCPAGRQSACTFGFPWVGRCCPNAPHHSRGPPEAPCTNGQARRANACRDVRPSAAVLEVLDGALVLFGGRPRGECPQVPAFARAVLLARVEAVLAGGELSDHRFVVVFSSGAIGS